MSRPNGPAPSAPAFAAALPDPCVLAVSGGIDSVSLLEAAVERGARPIVAHFNHRWSASEDDVARFVRSLARRCDLPWVEAHADRPCPGDEAAARDERYAFLIQTARRLSPGAGIVTAHTANDQAETLLMHLARGAGLRGLGGIRTQSERDGIAIVRPWLLVTRSEVMRFALSRALLWMEDPWNKALGRTRPRIRHRLLPALQREWPGPIERRLAATCALLAEDDAVLARLAAELLAQARDRSHPAQLVLKVLRAADLALMRRAIGQWLREANVPDVTRREIEAVCQLLHARDPAQVNVGGDRWVRRRAGRLLLVASGRARGLRATAESF